MNKKERIAILERRVAELEAANAALAARVDALEAARWQQPGQSHTLTHVGNGVYTATIPSATPSYAASRTNQE